MTTNELAAQVKSLKETVGKLEKRITVTEDIEAIKKLQRAYGYYLEHWEEENLIGLWSHRPDITLEINAGGQYKGWEEIKKAFNFGDHYTAYGGVKKAPPEYLHILMPLSGIIDVEPDGINAKGRWYGFFQRRSLSGRTAACTDRLRHLGKRIRQRGRHLEIQEAFLQRYYQQPSGRGLGQDPVSGQSPARFFAAARAGH